MSYKYLNKSVFAKQASDEGIQARDVAGGAALTGGGALVGGGIGASTVFPEAYRRIAPAAQSGNLERYNRALQSVTEDLAPRFRRHGRIGAGIGAALGTAGAGAHLYRRHQQKQASDEGIRARDVAGGAALTGGGALVGGGIGASTVFPEASEAFRRLAPAAQRGNPEVYNRALQSVTEDFKPHFRRRGRIGAGIGAALGAAGAGAHLYRRHQQKQASDEGIRARDVAGGAGMAYAGGLTGAGIGAASAVPGGLYGLAKAHRNLPQAPTTRQARQFQQARGGAIQGLREAARGRGRFGLGIGLTAGTIGAGVHLVNRHRNRAREDQSRWSRQHLQSAARQRMQSPFQQRQQAHQRMHQRMPWGG